MALNFPHVPDVRLANSPLVEVVCQVRFPPILRITKEDPIDFQEAVRHRFPELALEQGVVLRIPGIGSGDELGVDPKTRLYRFKSKDGASSISLTADFYALSSTKYSHWENFAADLELAHQAAQKVYQLPYATRIGLRYINRLTLENTGAQNREELLNMVRGELNALLLSEGWTEPNELLSQLVLSDDSAKLTLRSAYALEEDKPFLLLDYDYFEESRLPLEGLLERTNRYHQKIYDAFRWSIRADKISVFQPVEEANQP